MTHIKSVQDFDVSPAGTAPEPVRIVVLLLLTVDVYIIYMYIFLNLVC